MSENNIVTVEECNSLINDVERLNYSDYMTSYIIVYNKITSIIRRLPMMRTTLGNADFPYVYRTRENFNQEIFWLESQLSFNTNYSLIKLSRANLPNQSTFYASLPIKNEYSYHRVTSILEAGKLYYEPFEKGFKYYTQSSWKIIKPFDVSVLCFDEDAIVKETEMTNAYNVWNNEMDLRYPNSKNEYYCFLNYISKYFSRSTNELSECDKLKNYVVSTAFYNSLISNTNVCGLLYSSATTESSSTTLACPPNIARNFLKMESVVMFKAYPNRNDEKYFSIEQCSDEVFVKDDKFFFNYIYM